MISKKDLEDLEKKYPGEKVNEIHATGLTTLNKYTSCSRLTMNAGMSEQRIIVENPEFPLVYTGYENTFGKYADSLIKAKGNLRIIEVISKFATAPRHIYIYVVQDMSTGIYDIIPIQHYENLSESHGYMKPYTKNDFKTPGSFITENDIISKAPSHDDFGNYMTGFNANTAFINLDKVIEDGILMSDEFANKTTFYQVEKNTFLLNKNHVLLDRFGDGTSYLKGYPDLMEDVKDNILCIRRQINLSNAASELTSTALQRSYVSDEPIYAKGKVVDINVYINDREENLNNSHRTQLTTYWISQQTYYTKIKNALKNIVKNKRNVYSLRLKSLYEKAVNFTDEEIKFSGPNGTFEYALVEITTCYKANIVEGCKIVNRFASKGVVCHIVPKHMMPRDQWGTVADIVMNPISVINRSNLGQLYEHELNFNSDHVRRQMAKLTNLDKQFAKVYEYMQTINIKQAAAMKLNFESMNELDKAEYILDLIENGIPIQVNSFANSIELEHIAAAYKKHKLSPGRIRIKCIMTDEGRPACLVDNTTKPNYFAMALNEDGNLIANFVTPHNIDDQKPLAKGLEDYVGGTDIYVPTSDKKDVVRLDYSNISDDEDELDITKRLPVADVKYIPDLFELDKNGCDDETTYVQHDDEDKSLLIRDFLTINRVIIAPMYFTVQKQMPDPKLSGRSVGTCSPLGIPNKTGKGGINAPINSTPITLGEMELFCLYSRAKVDIIDRWLATASYNPALRSELFNMLLYADPMELHNLDISKEDIYSGNIPSKKLNAFLYCCGYEPIYEEKEDIYSAFDGLDLSAEEMVEAIKKINKIS